MRQDVIWEKTKPHRIRTFRRLQSDDNVPFVHVTKVKTVILIAGYFCHLALACSSSEPTRAAVKNVGTHISTRFKRISLSIHKLYEFDGGDFREGPWCSCVTV